jgi:hypothetical protein
MIPMSFDPNVQKKKKKHSYQKYLFRMKSYCSNQEIIFLIHLKN